MLDKDNYSEAKSFEKVYQSFLELQKKLEERFDKLEKKIDSLTIFPSLKDKE